MNPSVFQTRTCSPISRGSGSQRCKRPAGKSTSAVKAGLECQGYSRPRMVPSFADNSPTKKVGSVGTSGCTTAIHQPNVL